MIQTSYDANGNVASITPPSRPAHSFGYTPVDLEESYTPPDLGIGNVAPSYTYNQDRQLVAVTRPDGQTLTLDYDTGGRLSTLTTPTGQILFTYHPTSGQVASITNPGGATLSYTYDGSLLTGTTWTGLVAGSVTRTYDPDFRVITESVNGANSVTFQYDPDSLLTGAGALALTRHAQHGLLSGTTLGSVTDGYTYSPFGELSSYQASVSGAPLLGAIYARDALGRITQKTETITATVTTTVYGYDPAGRLTDVTVDATLAAHYEDDANGNRLSVTRPGRGTVSGTYDAQDRMTSYVMGGVGSEAICPLKRKAVEPTLRTRAGGSARRFLGQVAVQGRGQEGAEGPRVFGMTASALHRVAGFPERPEFRECLKAL